MLGAGSNQVEALAFAMPHASGQRQDAHQERETDLFLH
jgi:hypothetical protein